MNKRFLFALLLCGFSFAQTQTLRVATFNLKWLTESATETRMDPWEDEYELAEHRRELADVLLRIHADVLCVQEVTSRLALEKLAAEPVLRDLHYRVLHVESADNGTGQDVAFLVGPGVSLATFSGHDIRRFADTLSGRPARMEKHDPRRQRLTKHAMVCLTTPKTCLLGLHLIAHPDDLGRTRRRETQALIAAEIVRREIVAKGYKAIVLGDFNDFDTEARGPSRYAYKNRRVLQSLMDYDSTRRGPELVNAVMKIRPASLRYSAFWDRNRNGKRDARDPHSLLDHILVDKSLAKSIVHVEIAHDVQNGEVSDHWPVVVDFKMK